MREGVRGSAKRQTSATRLRPGAELVRVQRALRLLEGELQLRR